MNKPLEPESPNAHPQPEDDDAALSDISSNADSTEGLVDEPPKVTLPDHIPAEHRSDTAPPTRKYFSNKAD